MRKVMMDPLEVANLLAAYADPANWQTLRMYDNGGQDLYQVCQIGPEPARQAIAKLKELAGV